MARHVISVCIFCFICATHSPCASHAAVGHEKQHMHQDYDDPNNPPLVDNQQISSREKLKDKWRSDGPNYNDTANVIRLNKHNLHKRSSSEANNNSDIDNSDSPHETSYLRKIFLKYGDGDTMTMEGFEKLINRLDLLQVLSNKLDVNKDEHEQSVDAMIKVKNVTTNSNFTCINRSELTTLVHKQSTENKVIDHRIFHKACPALLYTLISGVCSTREETNFHVHDFDSDAESSTSVYVWLYSIGAVVIISGCGVLALVIIPVMQKRFYKPLIQFLVALAVGTLAGDALLHLLPHAMTSRVHESHSVHGHHDHGAHDENMWKGFVAMLGLTFFFMMERFILLAGKWRKGKQKNNKSHSHVKVLNQDEAGPHTNDTQCMDKYNSIPYCYKDIVKDQKTTILDNSDIPIKKSCSANMDRIETNQNMTECPSDLSANTCTEINKMLPERPNEPTNYTVILREHGTNHHGHSHTHGHVHAAPQNFSSVAWMVIMGDGLHNFTDGMAIGAAFSGSIAGGFSTTVAVFCHELPHELGDFAMLLKAGMSIKQALFYNLLSSVLCIFGNIFGVWLGNTEYASSWVFAAASGMFIYIALVDMIPELSSAHEDEGNLLQCVLHLSGLLLGFGIMTLIALYEHDLKNIFNDPV